MDFEATVRGNKEAPIKAGRIVSAKLYDFIGKKVKISMVILDE
jgi:hypothetical protein